MSKVLVAVETIKIKDYIFSTNKLKLIRGASYLLDYMNQIEVPKILKSAQIEEKDILYIAAGNAKFFVEGREKAEKIALEIGERYEKKAPGARLVIKVVDFDGNVGNTIDRAAEEIAVAKSTGFKAINMDLPFIQKCELCSTNPAEYNIEDIKAIENHHVLQGQLKNLLKDEKESKFCNECLQKLVYSNEIKEDREKIGFYSIFRNNFQEKFPDYIQADELGDYADLKNFIGLVYSDGDGLGDFLKGMRKSIKENDKYQAFMGEFSRELDKITKSSLMETLEVLKREFPEKNGKRYYGEFLIVGGDDICAIFPSKIAHKISHRFQEIFEKKMMEFKDEQEKKYGITGLENITSSSGVVIAKSKTPAHYLFDKGIQLQKFAKAKRYQELKNYQVRTGYIDFQVIGSEGCVDLKKFRKGIQGLYNSPYSLEKFVGLAEFIQEMKEIQFPKTKIREIYDLLRNEEMQEFEKKLSLMDTISKMKDPHVEFLVKRWGFNLQERDMLKNFNDIFTVLENYDFIGGIK